MPLNRKNHPQKPHALRGVQFGQGNFLRGFVDYMIDKSNEEGLTDMSIAVVKPTASGSLENFHNQNNLYTVALRGRFGGEVVDSHRLVSVISQVVNPYTEFNDYLKLAQVDTLEFVFSNTTEAGIVFEGEDQLSHRPAGSFPGKLTQFLYRRYKHFQGDGGKGLTIIPCELIERNGDTLKEIVLQYIHLWVLEAEFLSWVEEHIIFANTLVDRIVTGYPRHEAEQFFKTLGYEDRLLTVAEPFALWVIESPVDISEKFPLDKGGLPVLFTKDISPYRERKVRILNGGHTAMALGAYLAGMNIVRDCMEDTTIRTFLERTLKDEIIPTINLPLEELTAFSESVIERFENPFIDHALLDISLNSVSKWKARILPSFKDYYKEKGVFPPLLGFSLATLILFYKSTEKEGKHLVGRRNEETYLITDSESVLDFFAAQWVKPSGNLVEAVLKNTQFWGEDLGRIPDFLDFVQEQVASIEKMGVKATLKQLF